MPVKHDISLTPKQKEILDFIQFYKLNKGYSPTLREIASHFAKNISTAQHFVEELETKGYLKRASHMSRGIEPTKDKQATVDILGSIGAGNPIEPLENPEPINVPSSFVSKPGQYYALRVKGDSMQEDGIWDNDIIVVKHQLTADNGDIVVAITENGALLKVLRKGKQRLYLESRNKNYDPIFPKELEIRGKFVGLIRKDGN